MSTHLLRPPAVLVLSILTIGLTTASVAAQSQSDLRRENQRLRAMSDELTRELDAIKTDLEVLRTENDRLSRLLAAAARTVSAGGTTLPPPQDPAVSIDETKPGASPRALFAAIAADYENEVAGREVGDPGDPQRTAYLRHIERWASGVNRQMKQPVSWHVEAIGTATRTARGFVLRLRAVDPKTGAELGDPFDVFLTRAQASRLELHLARTDAEALVLTGTLRPRIHINEDRMSEGAFNILPLVGPFAEFAFGVSVQTLLPPSEEQEEQAAIAPTEPAKDGEGR